MVKNNYIKVFHKIVYNKLVCFIKLNSYAK